MTEFAIKVFFQQKVEVHKRAVSVQLVGAVLLSVSSKPKQKEMKEEIPLTPAHYSALLKTFPKHWGKKFVG